MNTIKKGSDALNVAKEALTNTDKEKYPKLYESREATVKALEYGSNQKIRAEKAENKKTPKKEKKTLKNKGEETPTNDNLSQKDLIAVMSAKIHEDDIDEVVDYAKHKEISIKEALKTTVVKTILSERKEERETAAATNTGKGRQGSSKVSGKSLLNKAESEFKIPESMDDTKKLVEARLKSKQGH